MEGKLKIQSPKPTRLLAGLAILVVLAGAGYLAYLGFKQPSSSTKTFTSIAVLPFADMSPEKNQEYLGDGLADDIISALSGIPELRVIGRTSSFQFKGSQVDLREVGDKLDVETVLEGSVQKSGNTLRITAQLINVEDGSHIWSRRWDREMTELFDVQDEIANGIREMLKVSLQNSGRESGQIVPEAYEAFLRGRQLWLRGNPNNLNHAMNHFRHAMNLEPGFADAAALLSLSYYQLGIRPLPVLDPLKRKQALDSSFWLARLAVSLDPNSATAHLAMAEMHQHYYEWEKAESELRRAHALNPGTLEKGSLGEFLGHLSSFESGSEFCLSGLSMDPLDINGMITYAHLLNDYGRYDEAIELTMRVLRMDSMSTRALAQLGHAYSGKKQYQEALLAWARQHESYGNHTLANKYRISEYREAMDAWIEEAENNQGPASPSNLTIAAIHAYLGDKEKVIHHLYLAYENRDGHIGSIKNRVIFGFIRDDPRWKELYKKLRFDKYDEFRASADKSP
jgi:TolB-like protein